MKIGLLTSLLLSISTIGLGQLADTIKIKITVDKKPLPGATIIIKDLVPPTGAATAINGLATLIIPKDKDIIEISFLGPYTRLKIERPTDYICFDLNSKKAIFYNDKKKLKTKKQIVSGY